MSYNKKQVLEANTKAITIALSNNKTTEDFIHLKEYKGFGGIKAILLPPDKPELFSEADKNLIEPIKQLHQILKDNSKDNSEYEKYLLSIKNSRQPKWIYRYNKERIS
ncbi:hypothetical protein [Bacteroides sp. 51]|uniref:hypothetical protein n=1 Tax=Bacteroides sp. 51 TaxID=2302938 RepID=UPI0013D6399F|nr:hypothetical protein [Bacteroides sp. 51]NDV83380.1 hypothetical protein [Bacteroides sp. 51]